MLSIYFGKSSSLVNERSIPTRFRYRYHLYLDAKVRPFIDDDTCLAKCRDIESWIFSYGAHGVELGILLGGRLVSAYRGVLLVLSESWGL